MNRLTADFITLFIAYLNMSKKFENDIYDTEWDRFQKYIDENIRKEEEKELCEDCQKEQDAQERQLGPDDFTN